MYKRQGILPGSAAYVALGAFGLELGPPFWIAVAVLGVLILGGVVTAAILRRRGGDRSSSAQRTASGHDA